MKDVILSIAGRLKDPRPMSLEERIATGHRLEAAAEGFTAPPPGGAPRPAPRSGGYPDAPGYSNNSTSKAAARSMVGDPATKGERTVLAALAGRPSTCEQLETRTGLSHQTCSARLRHLSMKGLIADTGFRETNRSGRKAIVWRAVT